MRLLHEQWKDIDNAERRRIWRESWNKEKAKRIADDLERIRQLLQPTAAKAEYDLGLKHGEQYGKSKSS